MNKLLAAIRRTYSIARKEFVHIWMDPGALVLVLVAPAVLLMLLAYIFTLDAGDANLAVVDQDQTTLSAEYIRHLTADGHLHRVGSPASTAEAVALLASGRADAAIIIPPGFAATLSSGGYAPVQNVVDGVDAGAARQIMGDLSIRTHRFVAGLNPSVIPPIDVRPRVWYNETLSSQHSMVPGLMALVLILPGMAVALGITREKETGTLETLVTTPVLGSDVLVGKLLVYLVLGTVAGLIALGVASAWFRIPFRGSLLLWLMVTAAYLLAVMAASLLIAHFARTQQTAMVIILILFFIPGFMMSGLSDPVSTGSFAAWLFAQLLPTTHYIALSRDIVLKALPLSASWFHYAVLMTQGIVGTIAAVTFFEKKIA